MGRLRLARGLEDQPEHELENGEGDKTDDGEGPGKLGAGETGLDSLNLGNIGLD